MSALLPTARRRSKRRWSTSTSGRCLARSVAAFQNTRFKIADMRTGIDVAQAFIDPVCDAAQRGQAIARTMRRRRSCITSELEGRVTDNCCAAARWSRLHGRVSRSAACTRQCARFPNLRGHVPRSCARSSPARSASTRARKLRPGDMRCFIGLGVMGYPMAGYLAKNGHDVAVYNRTAATAGKWCAENTGSKAATPAAAASGRQTSCSPVLVMTTTFVTL